MVAWRNNIYRIDPEHQNLKSVEHLGLLGRACDDDSNAMVLRNYVRV